MNPSSGPKKPLRVVVADDHPVAREGLRKVLGARRDFTVVGEAADGVEALHIVRENQPDVAILDVSMPQLDGIAAAQKIRAEFDTKVVLVTAHDGADYVRKGLVAGASGYVPKFAPPADIVDAVQVVARGETYIHPSVAQSLIMPLVRGRDFRTDADFLSPREEETLRLIARGFANDDIAATLGLSVKTIETYKSRGMEKLGLRSRPELMKIAVQRGWL